MLISTENLDYPLDILNIYQKLSTESYAVLLDSGKPQQTQGRFDIITAAPEQQLWIEGKNFYYQNSCGTVQTLKNLQQLQEKLQQYSHPQHSGVPFTGAWLGFAEYELGELLFNEWTSNITQQVIFWAGYYAWAIVQDHLNKTCQLIWNSRCSRATLNNVKQKLNSHPSLEIESSFKLTQAFQAESDLASYCTTFNAIQEDIEQARYSHLNFAQRFSAPFQGDPFAAYQVLRETVPSHYMAYINHPKQKILSISPECYIKTQGRTLQTQPIKGTAPRSTNPQEDQQLANTLQQSEKNRYENWLTVEAAKQELAPFCTNNTLIAEPLYELQSFANVHHLVSTLSGQLKAGLSAWDVFFACFPGASISGHPKDAALSAIKQYEQQARGPYCGSIFIADDNGYFDANIAIRTFICQNGIISTWAGGGITNKSSCEDEYQECFNKIQAFLDILKKMI